MNLNQNTEFRYTHIREDGNRYVEVGEPIDLGNPLEIELKEVPKWIVSSPEPDSSGSIWGVVHSEGTEGFRVASGIEGGYERVDLEGYNGTEPTTPPVLALNSDRDSGFLSHPSDASKFSHPVLVESNLIYVDENGNLIARDMDKEKKIDEIDIGALPDARIVKKGSKIAVLGDATTEYNHGALGDSVEAGALYIVNVGDGLEVETKINFGNAVVEGISPIWTDVTGDNNDELVVTETDASNGARIVAYGKDGNRVGEAPAIGKGFRWRHQLCVAPFFESDQPEVAVVRTPHIGGIVEFYKFEDGEGEIVARVRGYSSHSFDSRNLDGGVAGDFDDDGKPELVVPTDSKTSLGIIERTARGAETQKRIEIDSKVSTNISGSETGVGVGTQDSRLLVWR